MADLLGGRIPERSPRPVEDEEIEVEVHLLSGRNSLIQIGWESTPRRLREVLRSLWICPFLTLYDLAGELLEFDKPLRHQVGMEHGKYQVQAIAQHPCLVCNEQAALFLSKPPVGRQQPFIKKGKTQRFENARDIKFIN